MTTPNAKAVQELRAEARRCRRLATGWMDERINDELQALAAELKARAAAIEATGVLALESKNGASGEPVHPVSPTRSAASKLR